MLTISIIASYVEMPVKFTFFFLFNFSWKVWELWGPTWNSWQVPLWYSLLQRSWSHALPHPGRAFHHIAYSASEWQVWHGQLCIYILAILWWKNHLAKISVLTILCFSTLFGKKDAKVCIVVSPGCLLIFFEREMNVFQIFFSEKPQAL